ncbi:MAG: response regulator transcription factor [Betaproteobacteria bacterium]
MLNNAMLNARTRRQGHAMHGSIGAVAAPIVYIVDVDNDIRQSLMLWLGMRGYRTQELANDEEFLHALKPDVRGCTISHVRLQDTDGLQLHAKMRESGIKLPVLFITGRGDVATARTALQAGAFDFIEKPFYNERLAELVAHAVAEDRSRWDDANQAARLQQRLERLTQRERQVMDHVVAGLHNPLLRHRRNDLRPHAHAADPVVHRLLAVRHRQGRDCRAESEAYAGRWFLPDRMGQASVWAMRRFGCITARFRLRSCRARRHGRLGRLERLPWAGPIRPHA